MSKPKKKKIKNLVEIGLDPCKYCGQPFLYIVDPKKTLGEVIHHPSGVCPVRGSFYADEELALKICNQVPPGEPKIDDDSYYEVEDECSSS